MAEPTALRLHDNQSFTDQLGYAVHQTAVQTMAHQKAPFRPRHAYPIKCANDPFKFEFLPLDALSSALSMDVPRILVGLEMIDCRAIEAP
eukprot:scaffold12361_cov60-Attheya_sp.AAC.1